MRTLNLKDKIIYILFLLVLIAIFIYTIDGFKLYDVSSSELIPYSIKKIAKDNENKNFIDKSYIVEDKSINNLRILVFKIGENYDILLYTKSIIYGRYSVYKSLYNIRQSDIILKDGIHLGVKDPLYRYSVDFSINKEDSNILISSSSPKNNFKEIVIKIIMHVLVVLFIYLFRKNRY